MTPTRLEVIITELKEHNLHRPLVEKARLGFVASTSYLVKGIVGGREDVTVLERLCRGFVSICQGNMEDFEELLGLLHHEANSATLL